MVGIESAHSKEVPRADIGVTELAELPAPDLLARSVAPIIRRIGMTELPRRGEVVRTLDEVRGTLFGYWVLYTHGRHALTGFCNEMPHRVVDPNFFTLLELSLARIGDDPLLDIVRDFRAEIARATAAAEASEKGSGERPDGWAIEHMADIVALLDAETMSTLDDRYRAVDEDSARRVADYIRSHAEQVFEIIDDGENRGR